ncbi:prephenate dehydrogenase/arogenate dehydrogenase family protein [Candidatus Dojkabacteria bacterium]|uniref:Prephenate dehydrogenase/arogenate dehydrogenase family protein n=1 Tax=Candidatus Dojkabacteria bacterium TaxID=2099670 RepID=A0A955L9M8_9BACT|nr:prephenate dehydrogenase/arogenate dehydrogenase family protein [Candidatus Dojkabacteria bacterium]
MKYKVGIIGNGRFGDNLYKTFERNKDKVDLEPFIYSRSIDLNSKSEIINSKRFVSLKEICSYDIIIPTVPISVFEKQILEIKDLIPETSLVVDVCSVSIHPAKVMQDNLNCDLLSTHPMFGPDSTKDATFFDGLKFIHHSLRIKNEQRVKDFLGFWKDLGCELIELTPEEHDKQAAYTHAYAFLIGKIGIMLEVRRNDISTKGFEGVLYNQEAVENDTGQLFNDMLTYNPFAKEMFEKFGSAYTKIGNDLGL